MFRDEIVEDRPWNAFDQDEMTQLLARQDGVIGTRQALRFLSEKAMRHRVASGRWRSVHRGVMLTHTGWITRAQRLWIAVLAAGSDRPATLGGLTALTVLGLRKIRSESIDVIVPSARRLKMPAGVALRRVAHLASDDIDRTALPPSTVACRSVVDAAQWARSDNEARLIIAASFQQRLVRLPEIDWVLERMPNAKRRRLIVQTSRDCDGGSHSIGELNLLKLCRRAGLPPATRQFRWRDRDGRRRYGDAVFEEWKVAVEIDGVQHGDVDQMWDDASRQNDLELAGYTVLRYPVAVVRNHAGRVVADIRRALLDAGWVPR